MNNLTRINNHTFNWCKALKEVKIPDSVTEICDYAFIECISLRKVQFSNNLTVIGDSAFCKCKSLQKIHIPENVRKIENYSFYDCRSLMEVHLPNSLKDIENFAFKGCKSLQEMQIPNGTGIGAYTFFKCESLRKIMWGEEKYNVKSIDGYCMHIRGYKTLHDMIITKVSYFPEKNIVYVVEKNGYAAHGDSIRRAVEDLQFKIRKDLNDLNEHIQRIAKLGVMTAMDYRLLTGACYEGTNRFLELNNLTWEDTMPVENEHIQRIAKLGVMTAMDYRLLTGACYEGTNRFLELNNLTWEDTMPVEKVLQLTKGQYGYEKFKAAAEQILKLM